MQKLYNYMADGIASVLSVANGISNVLFQIKRYKV